MREENRGRRDFDNLFNYINLSLFCNKLVVELLDFKRTGSKSESIESLFRTLEQLFAKYRQWTPEHKYKSIVDHLLNSEEESQLFAQSIQDSDEAIEQILEYVNKIKGNDKITQQIEPLIDDVIKFLMILSDYMVTAQNMDRSFPGSREKAIQVSLK